MKNILLSFLVLGCLSFGGFLGSYQAHKVCEEQDKLYKKHSEEIKIFKDAYTKTLEEYIIELNNYIKKLKEVLTAYENPTKPKEIG